MSTIVTSTNNNISPSVEAILKRMEQAQEQGIRSALPKSPTAYRNGTSSAKSVVVSTESILMTMAMLQKQLFLPKTSG